MEFTTWRYCWRRRSGNMMTLPINSIFICLWMQIVLIRSEVKSNHYTQQPRYTGKFLTSVNVEEYKADLVVACLGFCGPLCTCFGYQLSTKRCRVYDFCLDRDFPSWKMDGRIIHHQAVSSILCVFNTYVFFWFDILNCF